MQKKVIKVDLALLQEMEALYEKAYDDAVRIGANISDGCLKIEKEMIKLKSISTKPLLQKLDEYEQASKRYGFPFESKYKNLRAKALAIQNNADKVYAKMYADSNAITTEMGSFLDKI
jgi:hypothetical protein